MLLQYCTPLHLHFLNVRFGCAGLLHLEHKTVEFVQVLEEDSLYEKSVTCCSSCLVVIDAIVWLDQRNGLQKRLV